LFGLQFAITVDGSRIRVVDKSHAVANKDAILNGYALADKGMARNFAITSNVRILLDLDKSPDLCVVADLTTVKVDKFRQLHVRAKFHVRRDTSVVIHI
jgi:hypothetical protein